MTSTEADNGHVDARRTDTRERILAVSTQLFREKGYVATSTQNIADQLGVTKAALYYHFESKEEILIALKQPIADALGEVLAKPRDLGSQAGRKAFVTDLVDTLVARGAGIASLMTDSRAQLELRELVEKTGVPAQVAGLLAAGISRVKSPEDAPPEAFIRVAATVGALHGAFDAWIHVNPDAMAMDDATRAVVIDTAVATLESGS